MALDTQESALLRLSEPRAARFLIRPFVPNIPMLGAILVVVIRLFVFEGYRDFLRDSDSGLHIRTGIHILTTGSVPRTDLYSFTYPERSWFAWEWLSDVVMAIAYLQGELGGVVLTYAVAFGICVWLWMRLHWIVGGNVILACAMAGPMLAAVNYHWLARPHVFSWALLLWTVLFFETLKQPLCWRNTAKLVAVMILWANIHASFFLAPVIGLCYAIGRYARPMIWRKANRDGAGACALASAIAIAATFVNPYGWRVHEHVYRFLRDPVLFDAISEYQGFDFHNDGAWAVMAVVVIAIVGAAASVVRRELAHTAIALLFVVQALRCVRVLPLLALVALPLANGALTPLLASVKDLRPGLGRALDFVATISERIRAVDLRFNGWATALVIVALSSVLLRNSFIVERTGFPADRYPVDATAAIARLPQNARLFAPDSYGGYLIYRFAASRKVFFDGRGDFYGANFFQDYNKMLSLNPRWNRIWESHQFTHALFPNNYILIAALRERGWKQIYRDDLATLLAAPQ